MGFIFGLIKRLLKLAVYLVLFITVVTLIPNLPPYSKFSSIELEPTQPRVGSLQKNGALNNAQKLYKDKLKAPECFALYNGELYTGVATGEVVKLSPGGHVTFVTKLGQPCEGLNQEEKCGRPLGLAIDEKTGQLYVADAYFGIWKVDIKTDRKQLLVSPHVEIEGHKPMLFNTVALAKNGDFYWTDSSSEFPLNKGVKSALADPSGRLLYYNAATNKSKVLLEDIWFANGIVVSPDQQFVVVTESNRYRLLKYYVAGPNKGKSEVFLSGLPGIPDNLRLLPDGSGFTVGMYLVFDEDQPILAKSIAKTPAIRKFLARLLSLIEMPFEFLNKQFPNPAIQNVAHNIASFKALASILPGSSGLLVVDWSGNIVESYFNTDGSLAHLSDAIVYRDQLLTGSPHSQDYVGAVPAPALLKKAYASVKSSPPPKTAETVTKPIPKETKPKVEEKKVVPKVAKPVEQPRPAAPVKTTPKPVERKAETTTAKLPTTTTKPSTTTTKPPTTTTKPPTTTTKPPTTTTKPPTTTTKPPTTTTKPPTTTTKPPTTTTKPPTTTTKQPKQKPTTPPPQEPEIIVERVEKKDQIPIIEDIPSDTAKPTKEKLKVIKKGGPTEIPNPEL